MSPVGWNSQRTEFLLKQNTIPALTARRCWSGTASELQHRALRLPALAPALVGCVSLLRRQHRPVVRQALQLQAQHQQPQLLAQQRPQARLPVVRQLPRPCPYTQQQQTEPCRKRRSPVTTLT